MNHPRTQASAARLQQRLAALHRQITRRLLLALALLAAFFGQLWWEARQAQKVLSSQPIGSLLGLHAGGADGRFVLETETAYYPTKRPLAAAKGVALSLELRGNGSRFICAPRRSACVETTRESLQ